MGWNSEASTQGRCLLPVALQCRHGESCWKPMATFKWGTCWNLLNDNWYILNYHIYIYNIIYKIMKVVISWGIRFIMLHGLCSSPARVQICSSTPFEIWLMHPTHRPTSSMPRASILREKSWNISSHTFSGIIRNPMISDILWFNLIHPLIHGAGSSWFIVAGWIIPLCGPTLIGHQPQDIFLAIKHLSRPC